MAEGVLLDNFIQEAFATASVRPLFGFKGRGAGRGEAKRPVFVEGVVGHSPQRMTGRWLSLTRRVDREHDWYEETVTDPRTGEVVHRRAEPLTQHQGYGTARSKREE